MKRRSFLPRAGMVIAGGTSVAGGGPARAQREAATRHEAADAKRVLITSAASNLSQVIAETMSGSWQVQATAPTQTDTRFPFSKSALDDDKSMDALLKGVTLIVHVGLPPAASREPLQIDFRTRATYNLLRAAVRQGVRRVLYLSSLAIMLGYEERFMVTEDFRPQPTPDPEILSHYLGEFTCREFARSRDLDVVVLRLGRLEPPEPGIPSSAMLPQTRLDDVAAAVALAAGDRKDGDNRPELGPWHVVHVHSEAGSVRFPLTKAKRLLGYQPK